MVSTKKLEYNLTAHGHHNISASHKTTLEITKEEQLTPKGSCIIGVSASAALSDLPDELKKAIRAPHSIVKLVLSVDGVSEVISGEGSPKLSLSHPTDIVCRKSKFTCSRTLMINCDKAAIDINRELIKKLKDPHITLNAKIIVEPHGEF